LSAGVVHHWALLLELRIGNHGSSACGRWRGAARMVFYATETAIYTTVTAQTAAVWFKKTR
jgi:hypothetical protein